MKLSKVFQKNVEDEMEMRAAIQAMKKELSSINMMDEFARYARLERKINKMTDKLKTYGNSGRHYVSVSTPLNAMIVYVHVLEISHQKASHNTLFNITNIVYYLQSTQTSMHCSPNLWIFTKFNTINIMRHGSGIAQIMNITNFFSPLSADLVDGKTL